VICQHNEDLIVVTEANVCWGKLEMVTLSPEVILAADVPCSGRQVAVTFIKSAIPAIKLKRSRPHNSRQGQTITDATISSLSDKKAYLFWDFNNRDDIRMLMILTQIIEELEEYRQKTTK
jgi:hypothetical protein